MDLLKGTKDAAINLDTNPWRKVVTVSTSKSCYETH